MRSRRLVSSGVLFERSNAASTLWNIEIAVILRLVAYLDERQPRDLTAEKLLQHSRLPLARPDQQTALGFA